MAQRYHQNLAQNSINPTRLITTDEGHTWIQGKCHHSHKKIFETESKAREKGLLMLFLSGSSYTTDQFCLIDNLFHFLFHFLFHSFRVIISWLLSFPIVGASLSLFLSISLSESFTLLISLPALKTTSGKITTKIVPVYFWRNRSPSTLRSHAAQIVMPPVRHEHHLAFHRVPLSTSYFPTSKVLLQLFLGSFHGNDLYSGK